MTAIPGLAVLATDLDGTFAGGTRAERLELVERLHDLEARMIYVTGRAPGSVHELMSRHDLPEPDVLIADVGTSVLMGSGPDRISDIEAELDRLWPGSDAIMSRLADVTDLDRQPVDAPRRVSWWIRSVRDRAGRAAGPTGDPFEARAPGDIALDGVSAALAEQALTRATAALADLEVDVRVSANLFLDVLPRGVNKGTTLLRVLHWLGTDAGSCVVAGDSLNDMSLFELGLRGVVVGNAEPALLQRTSGMPHVYHARGHGAAGVLEGLRHHEQTDPNIKDNPHVR